MLMHTNMFVKLVSDCSFEQYVFCINLGKVAVSSSLHTAPTLSSVIFPQWRVSHDLISEPVSIALSHIFLIFQFLLHQHFLLQGCLAIF